MPPSSACTQDREAKTEPKGLHRNSGCHIPGTGCVNADLEPQSQTVPATPVTQSPSLSIATLSDFMIPDIDNDESPVDPTTITPHDTFYLEDGNVEVLCGNTGLCIVVTNRVGALPQRLDIQT